MRRIRLTAASLVAAATLLGLGQRAHADQGWPREVNVPEGRIVIYQPQTDVLEGYRLSYRSAVSVTAQDGSEPVFGTVWVASRVETDKENRVALLTGFEIERVRFPSLSDEEQASLEAVLESEAVGWELEISLDRLVESLQLAEIEGVAAEDLKSDPPEILVENSPAVLITFDGDPIVATIPGGSELEQVVNTPFWIVKDPKKGDFYLFADGETWYRAAEPLGPWAVSDGKVPKKIRKSVPEEAREKLESIEIEGDPPRLMVATEPSELVVLDGEPDFEAIEGTDLLGVSDTESDLLLETTTQNYFLLLSGRWYTSTGLEGPWTFVAADALPDGFVSIPADGDFGHLLTFVAGTHQASEAIIEAQVPQTAAVKRTASIQVEYDGEPEFEAIEGTEMSYAVNTSDSVLSIGDAYYCVRDAVWYVAPHAIGPWRVATSVPDDIDSIPPSSPVYNTKYVEIYESTPSVVYMGYYPGYYGSYVWGPTIVWGTGWRYRPWWRHHYYPRYSTWGFSARYHPWYGWGFGFSYSTGRFTFGIGYGGYRRTGYWGPRGYYPRYNRNYVNINNINVGRPGTRPPNLPSNNLYARSGARDRIAATDWSGSGRPQTTPGVANNVYSDRAGNVYQRGQTGDWQSKATRPSQPTGASSRPSTSDLSRDYQARQRGTQRTQNYQRQGGGARRGGGGRRR